MEITITDQSAMLDPSELAEFLYLFPAVGCALRRIVPTSEHDALRNPTPEELAAFKHKLGRFSPNALDSFFDPKTSSEFLKINQIVRNSPLEITLYGCAFLISLGVIFSGGKISILDHALKAELPPFGKGLKSLRDALGLNNRIKAGFGIRETVIKLNKQEYAALCMQDDASKNNGGFQHFLVGLKGRVNKQTRELQLSPSDLERIYRYKANPKKGGWQSRFKKIFSRHFPEDSDILL